MVSRAMGHAVFVEQQLRLKMVDLTKLVRIDRSNRKEDTQNRATHEQDNPINFCFVALYNCWWWKQRSVHDLNLN
ncbi:hypothetical protein L596_019609 [Steinernema carpocapsae]|uniref:Uncharacterized protein n=1 Tax=Steinernema carpocapsae TaxID=34508 RepID=A0A4U5MR09_STECR|nr:hypothetical protein L596_019609 [Steinernema carpocapsae]